MLSASENLKDPFLILFTTHFLKGWTDLTINKPLYCTYSCQTR